MKRRLAVASVVALVALAAMLDVAFPVGQPAAPAAPDDVAAGVLACPAAVEPGARAQLHLANVGTEPARARVSIVPGARKKTVTLNATVAPGGVRSMRLHGRVDGPASVFVDYAGGTLVASHSLLFKRTGELGAPRGGGASACTGAGPRVLAIPHVRTLNADTVLVLANPGAADAYVTIALIAGKQILRKLSLENKKVPARGRRVFSLGDSAFDQPEITAVVTMENGRVVPEAMVKAARGFALVGAVAPADVSYPVAGFSGAGATLGLATVGRDDAGIDARIISATDEGRAPRVPVAVAPDTTATVRVPTRSAGGAAGYRLTVTVGAPLVAGTSWRVARRGSSDIAGLTGAGAARHWAGVIGSPESSAVSQVMIMVPGSAAAQVRVRRLGGDGAQDLQIDAGRLVTLRLGRGAGTYGVEVTADQPVVVALRIAAVHINAAKRGSLRVTVFADGVEATVLPPPATSPIVIDQRAAVPAPAVLQ